MKVPIFTKTHILVLPFLIGNQTKHILKHKQKIQSVRMETIENWNKTNGLMNESLPTDGYL